MFKYFHLFVLFSAFIFVASPEAHAEKINIIGHVTEINGAVYKILEEKNLTLTMGQAIFLNDTIEADKGARVAITFIDQTDITLGEASVLTIDEYVFDPQNAEHNAAEFSIKKGAFHYLSGLIAKKENPDVTLKLDFGSIGIRGTEIWRDMNIAEDGAMQCRIYLENGSANVYNEKGSVVLGHGDGTKIKGLENAPTPSKPWGEGAIADIKSKTAPIQ